MFSHNNHEKKRIDTVQFPPRDCYGNIRLMNTGIENGLFWQKKITASENKKRYQFKDEKLNSKIPQALKVLHSFLIL